MISCVWFNLLKFIISLGLRLYGLDMQTKHHIKVMHFLPIHSSKKKRSFTVECLPEKVALECTLHSTWWRSFLCVKTCYYTASCIFVYEPTWEKKMKFRSSQDSDLGFWISVRCLGHWSSAGLKDRWCSSTHIGSPAQCMNINKKQKHTVIVTWCLTMSKALGHCSGHDHIAALITHK